MAQADRMVRIVDRRFDARNKSAVNRQRFLRRFRGQVRDAVREAIAKRGIRDIDNGEKIHIPGRDIAEPQFHHGREGVWRKVNAGNDRFASGDEVERPEGGAGGGGQQGSPDGKGTDDFVFTLTREEFLDIFFDDLALPNLVKTQLARIEEYKRVRAGFTSSGIPANISIKRSLRGAAGRRIAFASPLRRRIVELEQKLAELLADHRTELDPEVKEIRREIARLKARIEGIPFIDAFDLRYNNRVRVPQPSTQAVMFCLMDVSGSMDEMKKQIAKRFFMLLYLFLTRTYEHIELVFVRHHTSADEVDEDEFFHSRESGGTVVSSALELAHKIIRERFASSAWNIYIAQASDGDNWDADSPRCREILDDRLLPLCQYFAYIEITAGVPQNLWREYEKLAESHAERFAMQRIAGLADIFPVFRSLFQKKLT